VKHAIVESRTIDVTLVILSVFTSQFMTSHSTGRASCTAVQLSSSLMLLRVGEVDDDIRVGAFSEEQS